MNKMSSGEDHTLSFDTLKSFLRYKIKYNVEEVLRRVRRV